jgi:hypothetical protein
MSRDARTQLAAVLVLVACLAGSTVLAVSLTSQAGRAKITYTDRAEEGAPWEVSLGIAMGAFRGVFVNFLWMRANDMKEAGKFYEAVQLSDSITRLQPRFPRVWVFHAWNLAYNISVETQTREERWEWVNAGIRLLRDRGIPANPNDMLLHKELGWIFLHKVGGFTDDANVYYKQQLAKEWTIVVGPPPPRGPEDKDKAKIVAKYVAWIAQYRDAPDTREEMWARNPETRRLADDLSAIGVRGDLELLQRYEMWRAGKSTAQKALWESAAGEKLRKVGALIDDPSRAGAWRDLLAFVRKRILVDVYHMEPDRMVRYTETFGPIDWRHHAAHSLYWSMRGVEVGEMRAQRKTQLEFDFVNTDRIVVQSIQDLYRSGDLYFDFFSSMFPNRYALYMGAPNIHFVESYGKMLDPMRQRGGVFTDSEHRGWTSLASGYENFLRDAICFYYARGDAATAEKWRTEMVTFHGNNTLAAGYQKHWDSEPLPVFVMNELQDEFTRPAIAIQQTVGAFQGAFTTGLLGGDQDLFLSQMNYAKIAHRLFFEAQDRYNQVDAQQSRMTQLPREFPVCAGIQFVVFMEGLGLDDAERVYDRAPDDLKSYAYDMLMERYKPDLDRLYEQGRQQGARPFGAIFPEPKGLDEARLAMKKWMASRESSNVQIEKK